MQELTIIKVGGKVVEDHESLGRLIKDMSAMSGPKILVHGGGRSATSIASRLGIETQMVEGRRVTDSAMLEVVTMVYAGLVNKNIVAGFQANGQNALGMTGADMNIIRSKKREKGSVDYGFVGDIEEVDAKALASLLKAHTLPVIAPITHNGKGQLLNTNADTMASAVASALAGKYKVTLIFCFELEGVLENFADASSLIPLITPDLYKVLKETKVVEGGMIPKLDNGFEALKNGVFQIRITNIDGLAPGIEHGTYLRLK
jgi:acetylglutamate kinase